MGIYSGDIGPSTVGISITMRSQCSLLIAHWLSVPEDHGSNPGGGEKINVNDYVILKSKL